jgi:hypothetical protein
VSIVGQHPKYAADQQTVEQWLARAKNAVKRVVTCDLKDVSRLIHLDDIDKTRNVFMFHDCVPRRSHSFSSRGAAGPGYFHRCHLRRSNRADARDDLPASSDMSPEHAVETD